MKLSNSGIIIMLTKFRTGDCSVSHWGISPMMYDGICPAELRSCVRVEADVLGSLSLIVRTVPVDVKQH